MRPALAMVLVCAGLLQDARADADPRVILRATARLIDPAPVPFAATTLGRATHRVRVTLTNPSSDRVVFAQPMLHWAATRDAIDYVCEDRSDTAPRGTIALPARTATSFDANMTCELPLPGDYDVMLRIDAAGAPVARASLVVTITAGTNAPVRLAWEPRAWVAVTGTREVRPGRAEARVVIATINGGPEPLAIEPFAARVRLFAPGTTTSLCNDQIVPIDVGGKIPAGRMHQAWATLDCRPAAEGIHAVDVSVVKAGTEIVSVARYTLRVRNGPLLPLPQ